MDLSPRNMSFIDVGDESSRIVVDTEDQTDPLNRSQIATSHISSPPQIDNDYRGLNRERFKPLSPRGKKKEKLTNTPPPEEPNHLLEWAAIGLTVLAFTAAVVYRRSPAFASWAKNVATWRP